MRTFIPLITAFLIYALNFISPQITILTNIFIPIFFILYLDNDTTIKSSAIKQLILILSFVLLSFYNIKISFNLFFMAAIPALFVIYRYKLKKIDFEPIIFAPLPAFLLTIGILIFSVEQKEFFIKYINYNIDQLINSIKDQPLDEISSRIKYIINNREQFTKTALYLIPSISFIYISFMTLIAKKIYLVKNRIIEPPFKVPFHLVWVLIIGGFTILSNQLEIKLISYNTFIIFTYLYFIQGSNLLTIFFIKKRLIWLRFILLIILLIHPYVIIAIAFIGLFDTWFNFGEKIENDPKE